MAQTNPLPIWQWLVTQFPRNRAVKRPSSSPTSKRNPARSRGAMTKGLLTIVGALIVLGAGWMWFSAAETKAPKRLVVEAGLQAIACLGRIEPQNGVMHLAAPYSVQGPSMIANLLVVEGQIVASNQVLAVTSNHETLKAEYEMAECQVKVAE